MTDNVPSPCVSICALDENDVCVGCFRSGTEISQWGRLSNEQKRDVLKNVAKREYESMYPSHKVSSS